MRSLPSCLGTGQRICTIPVLYCQTHQSEWNLSVKIASFHVSTVAKWGIREERGGLVRFQSTEEKLSMWLMEQLLIQLSGLGVCSFSLMSVCKDMMPEITSLMYRLTGLWLKSQIRPFFGKSIPLSLSHTAIEAMKNAHRSELERELEKARKANSNTENADIEEIRRQHE